MAAYASFPSCTVDSQHTESFIGHTIFPGIDVKRSNPTEMFNLRYCLNQFIALFGITVVLGRPTGRGS